MRRLGDHKRQCLERCRELCRPQAERRCCALDGLAAGRARAQLLRSDGRHLLKGCSVQARQRLHVSRHLLAELQLGESHPGHVYTVACAMVTKHVQISI